jgi:hypothetical protein
LTSAADRTAGRVRIESRADPAALRQAIEAEGTFALERLCWANLAPYPLEADMNLSVHQRLAIKARLPEVQQVWVRDERNIVRLGHIWLDLADGSRIVIYCAGGTDADEGSVSRCRRARRSATTAIRSRSCSSPRRCRRGWSLSSGLCGSLAGTRDLRAWLNEPGSKGRGDRGANRRDPGEAERLVDDDRR